MNARRHNNILAELGQLLILAEIARQKKTAESDSTYQAGKDSTVDQRQQVKASVQSDSNRH